MWQWWEYYCICRLKKIWFHTTFIFSLSYGLQCALHHVSTWFSKWNLSMTIDSHITTSSAVGVKRLLTPWIASINTFWDGMHQLHSLGWNGTSFWSSEDLGLILLKRGTVSAIFHMSPKKWRCFLVVLILNILRFVYNCCLSC